MDASVLLPFPLQSVLPILFPYHMHLITHHPPFFPPHPLTPPDSPPFHLPLLLLASSLSTLPLCHPLPTSFLPSFLRPLHFFPHPLPDPTCLSPFLVPTR